MKLCSWEKGLGMGKGEIWVKERKQGNFKNEGNVGNINDNLKKGVL